MMIISGICFERQVDEVQILGLEYSFFNRYIVSFTCHFVASWSDEDAEW